MKITMWSSLPPPVGGATRANEEIKKLLRDTPSLDFFSVATNSPTRTRKIPKALGRRGLHLIAVSESRRLLLMAPILLIHRSGVLIHGTSGIQNLYGGLSTRCIALLLRRCERVWVNNSEVANHLARLDIQTTIVSPWTARARVAGALTDTISGHRILTSVYTPSAKTYNLDLVIEAVSEYRQSTPEVQLTVLTYGGQPLAINLPDWVTVRHGSDRSTVSAQVHTADIFIRATDHDGDSGIVREALSHGCRVLASNRSPRPAGVELFDLSAPSLAHALASQNMNPVSAGAGLGQPINDAISEWIGWRL